MTRRTVLALALPAILPAAEEFALVIKKGDTRDLTKVQIKSMILGLAIHPTGGRISLLLGPSGEPSRVAALQYFAGLTEKDYTKIVLHLAFVGQTDDIPLVAASTAEVRQKVHLTPGIIGVIRPTEVNESVSVLTIK